jgi:hypothetical protein
VEGPVSGGRLSLGTLRAGLASRVNWADVISMGTAFRQQAGAKRSLHSADLQRVDGPMQVEITGLGALITPVLRKPMELGEWRLRQS